MIEQTMRLDSETFLSLENDLKIYKELLDISNILKPRNIIKDMKNNITCDDIFFEILEDLQNDGYKINLIQSKKIKISLMNLVPQFYLFLTNPSEEETQSVLIELSGGSDFKNIYSLLPGEIKNDKNLLKIILEKSGDMIEYIDTDDIELMLIALKESLYAFANLKEHTYEMCEYVANKDARFYFEHSKIRDEHLDEIAILNNPGLIKFVEKPNKKMLKYAVIFDPYYLEHIEEQDEEWCIEATRQYLETLKYVKNITPNLIKSIIENVQHYNLNEIEELMKEIKITTI